MNHTTQLTAILIAAMTNAASANGFTCCPFQGERRPGPIAGLPRPSLGL